MSALASTDSAPFDFEALRLEFPALHQQVRGKQLVYLDSAATSLKPKVVVEAIRSVYEMDCGNIHRAVHELSQRATTRFDEARHKVARFIGVSDPSECIFTRGTTESINLIASTFGRSRLQAGDEILVAGLEHHSNIVPWQMLCKEVGAILKVVPFDERGVIAAEDFSARISAKTKIVVCTHVSNALGTVLPIQDICHAAHARGAVVVVDGAQAAPHMPVDIEALGCDFYAFSGHKLYAPTGIGILWGKREHLEAMPPYHGGGDMIKTVTFEESTYAEIPEKFEAGTPHIAGAIGLGAAVDFLESVGMEAVAKHEIDLLTYATKALEDIPGIKILGQAPEKIGVLTFVADWGHPHDIGTLLDAQGVAIRTGHHCAQPVMDHFGVSATSRASLGIYSNTEDIDALTSALKKAQTLLG